MKYQTIITVADLAKFIDSSDCLILDCRGGALYNAIKHDIFSKGHIPTAFYFCYSTESFTNSDEVPSSSLIKATNGHQIIENVEFHGFNKSSQIVIYDDETKSDFTNSIWLLLRSIGYQYVAVLQGGYTSWEEQDMPIAKSNNSILESYASNFNNDVNLH